MKRIIYSIYTPTVDKHDSSTDYKKSQFEKYKTKLEQVQKDYASFCKADYSLIETSETNYDKIQFDKLIKLQELSYDYDEVLYLDFDVIPKTTTNIFDNFDTSKICVYNIPRELDAKKFKWELDDDNFHPLNVWVKCTIKKAMLLLDDITGTDALINTGVVLGSKESIKRLDWVGRLDECLEVYKEACEDNVYPDEVSRVWKPNNEAFFSYLIERYNIPMINIGISWNYILNQDITTYTDAVHFVHQVNKDFKVGLV